MDNVKRGDIVLVALQGDLGKPRPALIIQANQFKEVETLTVLPFSSLVVEAPLLRVTIYPNEKTGLKKISQVMVDKASTIKREKIKEIIGKIDDETMVVINRSIAIFMGIA